MNILVTNDDGIDAKGIHYLAEALSEVADIYVCAPHIQRSASGHGISIERPVYIEQVAFEGAKQALSMQGTPADCVKMGLVIFQEKGVEIHKVFSGINHGGNMGTDTVYSGTVSAALEGAICGRPSVAVSINAREPIQYASACKVAVQAAHLDADAIDPALTLNINVPNLTESDIRGIKVTGLGTREYHEWYERVETETGVGYRYSGYPVFYEGLNADSNDVGAFQANYIAITPLQFDLTNYRLIEKVRACDVWHKGNTD